MHVSFATTGLHGICNETEWKIGGGGQTLHSHSLGTGDKCPPPTHAPKIPSLVWDWEGAQKCFILHSQTTGDLKSYHLQARATLTAMSVPPRLGGGTKVFYPPQPDYRRFKILSFTSPGHTYCHVCAPSAGRGHKSVLSSATRLQDI